MKKDVIIVDIDGTICNSEERLKGVGFDPSLPPEQWPTEWGDVSKDKPIKEMVELVSYLQYKYQTFYVTLRDEGETEKTIKWLNSHKLFADEEHVFCVGDITNKTKDVTALKRNFVDKTLKDLKLNKRVAFCIEDSPNMIDMYREIGITCLDVGKFYGST
jgi:predicted secreted acid phosphatase